MLQVVSDDFDLFDPKCKPAIQDGLKKLMMLTQHRVGWARITKDFR